MPISTSSFGDERDNPYSEYDRRETFDQETLDFPGMTPELAETLLQRLGGGVAEKGRLLEGVGWRASITSTADGVSVEFDAHEELLDDLIRRFENMTDQEL